MQLTPIKIILAAFVLWVAYIAAAMLGAFDRNVTPGLKLRYGEAPARTASILIFNEHHIQLDALWRRFAADHGFKVQTRDSWPIWQIWRDDLYISFYGGRSTTPSQTDMAAYRHLIDHVDPRVVEDLFVDFRARLCSLRGAQFVEPSVLRKPDGTWYDPAGSRVNHIVDVEVPVMECAGLGPVLKPPPLPSPSPRPAK